MDSPLTTAIRQAGFEAAKKAGDAKKATSAKVAAQAKGSEQAGVSSEALRKLDNSAPTGIPPPAGAISASSVMAPGTGGSGAQSKADAVPATTSRSTQVTHSMEKLNLGETDATNSQPAQSTNELPSTEK